MNKRQRLKAVHKISCLLCCISVMGVLSAVGNMELGDIGAVQGFIIGLASVVSAILFGKLAGAAERRLKKWHTTERVHGAVRTFRCDCEMQGSEPIKKTSAPVARNGQSLYCGKYKMRLNNAPF